MLKEKIDPDATYIWFHAASLGEFEQGRPLMEKIRAERPEYRILLTFFSPSGYEVQKNYPGADIVCYLPFDFPGNARRFVKMARPAIAVFIKYEFWSNYINELNKKRIPIYLASAIFRKNQIFFRPYARRYARVLNRFNHFFVQNRESEELLATRGLTNVTITGDTRFDRVNEIYLQRKEIPLVERFVRDSGTLTLVAGSSWQNDEELLLPYFDNHPEIRLVLVPHEFDETRIREIRSKLKRPSVAYSQADEASIDQAECLIVDCFGLLSSIYRYGDIAYVGGGFGSGIHNILEAAVYGIPVLFGPNHKKFKEASDLIACRGGYSIDNNRNFEEKLNDLIAYPALREESGKSASDYVSANLGATEKIFREIFGS